MDIYLKYVLVGLAIALPVGAISIEMTKQGLKNGFIHGWAVGLGGMTIDGMLILALYFGLASILSLPYVQMPLWIIGACFLVMLGYDSIKNADKDITLAGEKPTKSFWSTYKNGILVAISPGNLVFWVSVFGTVLTQSYNTTHSGSFVIAAFGILSGIVAHDIGLLLIVATSRKVMSRNMIKWSSIIAGGLLFFFAGYFIYQFVNNLVEFI
ncbi:MAG TPA: LysE family transporter [Rummeliibacillus sp.]|nr:LysE family transporter [Rummeliibacillus sp.]